jgi:2-methylisocitrate lyase-like PEP mutase family enzyme
MGTAGVLREALRKKEQIVAPGIYDPLTAKAVSDLGFNGVYLGGFASSAPLVTMEPLMTMTEQVDLARKVAYVSGDLPVIVDGHTGYGDPVHVTRAVREFEAAGVAAIHIEDQLYPKRASYHRGLKHMVSIEEMEGRIRAACDARRNDDFVIVVRTEARGAVGGSLDSTIERCQAYVEAGADAILPMPHGLQEGRKIHEALPDTPIMWFAALGRFAEGEEVPLTVLRELNCLIVAYPIVGLVRAIASVVSLYSGLRDKGVVDVEGLEDGYENIMRLIDAPFYYELEKMTTEKAS